MQRVLTTHRYTKSFFANILYQTLRFYRHYRINQLIHPMSNSGSVEISALYPSQHGEPGALHTYLPLVSPLASLRIRLQCRPRKQLIKPLHRDTYAARIVPDKRHTKPPLFSTADLPARPQTDGTVERQGAPAPGRTFGWEYVRLGGGAALPCREV